MKGKALPVKGGESFLRAGAPVGARRVSRARSWTSCEAWLSMRTASIDGLVGIGDDLRSVSAGGRCTVRCIHTATAAHVNAALAEAQAAGSGAGGVAAAHDTPPRPA